MQEFIFLFTYIYTYQSINLYLYSAKSQQSYLKALYT